LTSAGALLAAAAWILTVAGPAGAQIPGLAGGTYTLTARAGYITTPEGGSIYMWGYANGAGGFQYPGPTLIVNEGAAVQVTLVNQLAVPTSIVFPGQTNVQAAGGTAGLLTQEAAPGGGTVVYSFTASRPGTFLYHSGTRVDLQTEMGLFGVIIVRPTGAPAQAYGHADTAFQADHEFLFLESEVDPAIHELVETGRMDEVDMTTWWPTYWFLNGRAAPDTMADPDDPALPAQPYNCMPMIHPGDIMLLRFANAGRDYHPFHPHGNNLTIIGRDAYRLATNPVGATDLSQSDFTITVPAGGTADALFTWTGHGLGWDIYGHAADVDNPPLVGVGGTAGPEDVDHNANGVIDPLPDMVMGEDMEDHGKPFPVVLPDNRDLTIGDFWSGSPFLGVSDALPPGTGNLSMAGSYIFMWHSHKEKEMVNNDVFPGGMMTMLMIMPPMPMPPMP
jgi:FtsP/CotA-like multicopper oxidase with cupredoxin domain